MNYSFPANLVNIVFIAAVFLLPVGFCLYFAIAPEVGRTVIMLSFFLAGFLIADWYHFYSGNSYSGIGWALVTGIVAAFVSVAIVAILTGSSIWEIAALESPESWDGFSSYVLRFYITGVGIVLTAVVSIPRLFLVKYFSNEELPIEDGI